jgi:hypothetical protein
VQSEVHISIEIFTEWWLIVAPSWLSAAFDGSFDLQINANHELCVTHVPDIDYFEVSDAVSQVI